MAELPAEVDVVVVGAGICGVACALSAACRGASVVVVEKEAAPAQEGSGWAQGALRIQGRHPTEVPLALEALNIWRSVAAQAEDAEILFGGNIYLCDDGRELPMLGRLVAEAEASGLPGVRLLSPQAARKVIPAATGPFAAAMWSPIDGHCHPAKATGYFARAAESAGARFAYRSKVLRVVESHGRVVGVVTTSGLIRARAVVLASGVWTPYLASTVGVGIPVMPVELSECETTPVPPLFRQSIRTFRFGGHQRPNGRVVLSAGVNATVRHGLSLYDLLHLRIWAPRLKAHRRDVKLRLDPARVLRQLSTASVLSPRLIPVGAAPPKPDVALMHRAFSAMREVLPGLQHASITRYWAGLVDMSPDGLPIIDNSAGPGGLVCVTGLSGHGLTLGPVLGEIAADLALTGCTSRPVQPFRLARFEEEPIAMPSKMI